MTTIFIAQSIPLIEPLTQLGIASVMGGLWLKERLLSQKRDTELSQAHRRMMQERIQLEALIALIRKNTDTMHRLVRTQEHLVHKIKNQFPPHRAKRRH